MVDLDDLSVGEVSGMIAAATYLLQLFIPLALPLILIGLLRERNSSVTTSAASWSVIGRFIHSSHWPSILGTDSATTKGVSSLVIGVSWLGAFVAVLVGVAAVVTPLGLYEGVFPASDPTPVDFSYVPDTSPMGYGTMPRADIPWSRICGGFVPVACPNSPDNLTSTKNESGIYVSGNWYTSRISPSIVDLFQSGLSTMEKSVSSVFDIQWRTYTWSAVDDTPDTIVVDNGTSYPVSSFRQMESLFLEDSIKVVEGLIVDMKDGGIGFRNHTAPPLNKYGSTWSEDILFIVPETQCVDTNLTLDYTVPINSSGLARISDLVLTDRGGFVNFDQEYLTMDKSDAQNNPQFGLRAYRAAWFNNVYSMAFLNVTNPRNENDTDSEPFEYLNSAMNKTFKLQREDSSSTPSDLLPGTLSTHITFGKYLDGTDDGLSNTSSTGSDFNFTSKPPIWENPFNISRTDFQSANLLCRGAGKGDNANITNFIAECGLMYGAPRREDGGIPFVLDPGSKWSVPMYSCISATKAVIKTVDFRFNGSNDDASSLTVTNLAEKVYPDESSKPLWGVENSNLTLADTNPLWGIVDPEKIGNVNISTIRKESLWLPGLASSGMLKTGFQNLPGMDFYGNALSVAYGIGDTGISSVVDYSGTPSLPMFRLWQSISRSADTAVKIPNLVWTDAAMNAVLGTRSITSNSSTTGSGTDTTTQRKRAVDETPAGSDQVPVTTYHRRIKYHLRFGVPAFIVLVFTLAIAFFTLFLFIFCRISPSKMRKYLNETSAGRMLTSQLVNEPGHPDLPASGKAWVNLAGRQDFALGGAKSGMTRDRGVSQDGGDAICLVNK